MPEDGLNSGVFRHFVNKKNGEQIIVRRFFITCLLSYFFAGGAFGGSGLLGGSSNAFSGSSAKVGLALGASFGAGARSRTGGANPASGSAGAEAGAGFVSLLPFNRSANGSLLFWAG